MPQQFLNRKELVSRKRGRSQNEENYNSFHPKHKVGAHDGQQMQRRGGNIHQEMDTPDIQDSIQKSYDRYKTWHIPPHERLLTREEFKDIGIRITSSYIETIVGTARNWGYFAKAYKLSPPPQAPASSAMPAGRTVKAPPTPSTTPQIKTSASPNTRFPSQPRAERATTELSPVPPKPVPRIAQMTTIAPDSVVSGRVREALKRKAMREQLFLDDSKMKLITEVAKLNTHIPKLAMVFNSSAEVDVSPFTTSENPLHFDSETITTGLRLLAEYEEGMKVACAKQADVLNHLRAHGLDGGFIAETENVLKLYATAVGPTVMARELLEDVLIIIDPCWNGQLNAKQREQAGHQIGPRVKAVDFMAEWK